MKETIGEYSRIIIVAISFALMIGFIFGGVWFNRIGSASAAMQNQVVQDEQQKILDELDMVSPPVIEVSIRDYKIGELIDLRNLITTACSNKTNEDGSVTSTDLKSYVVIKCNSPDYNKTSETLCPQTAGFYKVEYGLVDNYGQKTSKVINFIVNNY